MSTLLRTLVTLVIVALAAAAGWWLWHYYLYTPWTRDGRVRAEIITVAPDVSGRVVALNVDDNQRVSQGDTLFQIDPSRYQTAMDKAQAVVEQREAELELARHEASRRNRLGRAAISAEGQETSRINSRVASATLAQAQSALASAQLDLTQTTVAAPVAGHVLNLQLGEGNYTSAGKPVLALVAAGSYYVTGYFEETKMPRVNVGDRARVNLMGAEHELSGHVESIGRAIADPNTAPNEQLLPKVQPTFSWVRLAQRIPVRIALDNIPDDVTLSAGMTASVHIDPAP
ncbi:HlyD family secretion protein [Vreelandella subglaciescola]|jgi:RND family efflux transporter MFP subunit|uniref:RND family efflux transporter, MFP subunit n=1 Tax=Vreelandella subglaciescola TaxID=29571 RepID=A0A1M7HZJ9_9GAMM|nr:HlyD family secretion protein [Halomonas subglaciescola]SHM33971.1 RND family efflux transporter, MFP subunit [Halomonas subglaciescola]